jgi:hypothetical protein
MRNHETGDRHSPSSADLPPREHLAPRPIIEHMFYYYKDGKNLPPCIRTNVHGRHERNVHIILKALRLPTQR